MKITTASVPEPSTKFPINIDAPPDIYCTPEVDSSSPSRTTNNWFLSSNIGMRCTIETSTKFLRSALNFFSVTLLNMSSPLIIFTSVSSFNLSTISPVMAFRHVYMALIELNTSTYRASAWILHCGAQGIRKYFPLLEYYELVVLGGWARVLQMRCLRWYCSVKFQRRRHSSTSPDYREHIPRITESNIHSNTHICWQFNLTWASPRNSMKKCSPLSPCLIMNSFSAKDCFVRDRDNDVKLWRFKPAQLCIFKVLKSTLIFFNLFHAAKPSNNLILCRKSTSSSFCFEEAIIRPFRKQLLLILQRVIWPAALTVAARGSFEIRAIYWVQLFALEVFTWN